jgi:hypothetical protein
MHANSDKPVLVPYQKHVPPDVTACIFRLKNRRPGQCSKSLSKLIPYLRCTAIRASIQLGLAITDDEFGAEHVNARGELWPPVVANRRYPRRVASAAHPQGSNFTTGVSSATN